MGISDLSFQTDIWNNIFGLNRVMKGPEDFDKIKNDSQNPSYIAKPTRPKRAGGWEIVVTSTKAPLQSIFSVFLRSVAYLAVCVQWQKMARILTVFSQQMMRDWEQLTIQQEIKPPLVPAFCHHQTTSWDTYAAEDIAVTKIEDKGVKQMTFFHGKQVEGVRLAMHQFHLNLKKATENRGIVFKILNGVTRSSSAAITKTFTNLYVESPQKAFQYLISYYSDAINEPLYQLYDDLKDLDQNLIQNYSQVSLFSDQQLSRGGSIWFINLFLKTRHLFKNPEQHLVSVAEQFRTGIPRQGAIAQALWHPEAMMGIKFHDQPDHRISLFELAFKQESAKEKIQDLSPGIYRVEINQHSFVYVKMNDVQGYVWNPYFGLFKMKDNEMLDMILKYHYKPGNPASRVSFHKYEVDAKSDQEVI